MTKNDLKFAFFVLATVFLISLFIPNAINYDISKINEKEPPLYLTSPLPYKNSEENFAEISAKSYKAVDLTTNYNFLAKNPNEKLYIGSVTKLMSAVIVLENAKEDEIVTIPKLTLHPDETRIGLKAGDKMKVRELIKSALISSVGDAIKSLAIHTAGNEDRFVYLMNQKALNLGLTDTHFTNPSGLDYLDNYSSSTDLLNLARYALKVPLIEETIKSKNYTAVTESGTAYNLTNTNILLDGERFLGIKTGSTPLASECLLALSKEKGNKILIVVLGSSDRFGETRKIADWINKNFNW
ncbi:MAG: D-alanyl-D-alanine carboxypeptidase [Patescibacteria group bacterium]|nr:D-alanyl-D-alanine carboxypeptidase [Patescibacteria group bacterium]